MVVVRVLLNSNSFFIYKAFLIPSKEKLFQRYYN